MKQIIKWQADDGREFQEETECKAYESLCGEVASIMATFPAHPKNDGCRFANGHGFIQLSEVVVKEVRNKLLDLISGEINHRWVEESRDMSVHPSYVARLVGETGLRPLYNAWNRITCVDDQWREWGQPYYASHPDQGDQLMLASV
jgi:hypothetical protein